MPGARDQVQLLAITLVMLLAVSGGKVVCPDAGGEKLAMAFTRPCTLPALRLLPSLAVIFSTRLTEPANQSWMVTLSSVPITLMSRLLPALLNHSCLDVAPPTFSRSLLNQVPSVSMMVSWPSPRLNR